MADKEEIAQNNRIINAEKHKRRIKKGKIYIDVRNKKLNCILSKVYSSQEAIERMAKGLFKVDNVLALDIKWSQLKKSKQLVYKEFAEAALNALLEDKK